MNYHQLHGKIKGGFCMFVLRISYVFAVVESQVSSMKLK